jgi:hypothetical protein
MKMPITELGQYTCEGAGAAVGIGMEEGTWFRTVWERFSKIVGSLFEEKGCCVSKQIVDEAEINKRYENGV